jgi:hypothetical protein
VTFQVDIESIDEAGSTVLNLAPATASAITYLHDHVGFDGFGDSGIFVSAIGVLDQIRSAVDDELTHLRDLLTATATELTATASHYRTTDEEAASRLDRLYHYQATTQYGPGRQEAR